MVSHFWKQRGNKQTNSGWLVRNISQQQHEDSPPYQLQRVCPFQLYSQRTPCNFVFFRVLGWFGIVSCGALCQLETHANTTAGEEGCQLCPIWAIKWFMGRFSPCMMCLYVHLFILMVQVQWSKWMCEFSCYDVVYQQAVARDGGSTNWFHTVFRSIYIRVETIGFSLLLSESFDNILEVLKASADIF